MESDIDAEAEAEVEAEVEGMEATEATEGGLGGDEVEAVEVDADADAGADADADAETPSSRSWSCDWEGGGGERMVPSGRTATTAICAPVDVNLRTWCPVFRSHSYPHPRTKPTQPNNQRKKNPASVLV